MMVRGFAVAAFVAATLSTLCSLGRAQGGMAMPDACAQGELNQCSVSVWPINSFPHKGDTQSVTFSNNRTLTCTSNGRGTFRSCSLTPAVADNAGGNTNSNEESAQTAHNSSSTPRENLFPTLCDEPGAVKNKKNCDTSWGVYRNYEYRCVRQQEGGSKWVIDGTTTPVEPAEHCQTVLPDQATIRGEAPSPESGQTANPIWGTTDRPVWKTDPDSSTEQSSNPGGAQTAPVNQPNNSTGAPLEPNPDYDEYMRNHKPAPVNPFPKFCDSVGELSYKSVCNRDIGYYVLAEQICVAGVAGTENDHTHWKATGKYTFADPPKRCELWNGNVPPPPKPGGGVVPGTGGSH